MMHVEIYKNRPEINAIIHAHAPFSTALAVSGETGFPAILAEPVFMFGGTLHELNGSEEIEGGLRPHREFEFIPVVKYETPSTLQLAKSVAKFFEKNDAVLMANHGAVVCGNNLKEAFYKLETLEFYSKVYLFSGLLGKRSILPNDKINELLKLRNIHKKLDCS
jgi:L-fuculose-phosphate aldolase